MMKKQLLLTASGLVLISWINRAEKISKAEWLVGTWENKTPGGSIYESWNTAGPGALTGRSYMIKDKDTMIFETIILQEDQDGLVYLPVVKNQNKGQSVRFNSTLISGNKLVFENPRHDFPQVISYTRFGEDSLVAEISGNKNGKARKQVFPMKKIN